MSSPGTARASSFARGIEPHLRILAGVVALLIAACTASPVISPRPGVTPAGSPGASAAPRVIEPDPYLAAESPAIPGIYTTDAMTLLSTEYGGTLSSSYSCANLLAALRASEWRLVVSIPLRVPGSKSVLGYYALLSRGDEMLEAQLGGQRCAARLKRASNETVTLRGAVTATGKAQMTQEKCVVAGGAAELGFTYWGPKDLRVVVEFAAALKIGRQALTTDAVEDLVVSVGRSTITLTKRYQLAAKAIAAGREAPDADAGLVEYGPGSRTTGQIEVRTIDPLVGEATLVGLESGQSSKRLEIVATFRCDHAPGFLTRAAAPSPSPQP